MRAGPPEGAGRWQTAPMARYPSTIMVSCVVPWDEREEIDRARFDVQVRAAIAAGYRHLYVFGTAGEGYAVDTRRFVEVVEAFRDATAGPDLAPMVGVIALSTAAVIERIRLAHEQIGRAHV